MSLHRFFVPPGEWGGDQIRLAGPEAHHALHVLRVRRGDRALVLNGEGERLLCDVASFTGKEVSLQVIEKSREPAPACRITLFQAIPKGKLLESIIQKATELGVSRIVPLLTERVVARPEERDFQRKAEKWRSTAIEAVKQCGQAWLPHIEEPAPLAQVLQTRKASELELAGALSGEGRHPRVWFEEFARQHKRRPASAGAWIGPEGDFTAAELEMILNAGARPITLGPLVLRCETAAIYALSIIRHETSA